MLRPVGLAVCCLLVAALLVGPVVCLGRSSAPAMAAPPTAPVPRELREPPGLLPPPVAVDPDLVDRIGVAAAGAQATVAAVVVDAVGRPLVRTPSAGRPVYTASLVKVLLAQQLLAREAAGVVGLGPPDVPRLERRMLKLDGDEKALHQQLADAATDFARTAELDAKLRAVQAEKEQVEDDWLAATELAEG